MKNMGTFDPNWNPVKKGGLTEADKQELLQSGWKNEVTQYEMKDVDIGFADNTVPTGFLLYKFNVPAGTDYYYNSATGAAILTTCGNPTCWRWLT